MTMHNADPDFDYDDGLIFRKFFFSLMPLISFAVYSDDYAEMSGQNVDALKQICINSILSMWDSYIKEKCIVFQADGMRM